MKWLVMTGMVEVTCHGRIGEMVVWEKGFLMMA